MTNIIVNEEYERDKRFVKTNPREDAFVEFHMTAHRDGPLYGYFDVSADQSGQTLEIYVNGEHLGQYPTANRGNGTIALGDFAADEQLAIKIQLGADELIMDGAYFYQQDIAVFTEYYNELSRSPFQINSFADSYIEGDITNPGGKRYALFTVGYEEDWRIRVNGEPAETVEVFEALLAVEVPPGTHHITLRYVPRGLYAGLTITLLSLVALGLYLCFVNPAYFSKLFNKKAGAAPKSPIKKACNG
jgi:uncharacterized membrane protein YfhO